MWFSSKSLSKFFTWKSDHACRQLVHRLLGTWYFSLVGQFEQTHLSFFFFLKGNVSQKNRLKGNHAYSQIHSLFIMNILYKIIHCNHSSKLWENDPFFERRETRAFSNKKQVNHKVKVNLFWKPQALRLPEELQFPLNYLVLFWYHLTANRLNQRCSQVSSDFESLFYIHCSPLHLNFQLKYVSIFPIHSLYALHSTSEKMVFHLWMKW